MPSIIHTIVEYHINTWLDASLVRKSNDHYIHIESHLSISKLINYTKLGSFTPFPTHLGFPTLYQSWRNRVQYMYVLISRIWINHALRITIPHLLLIRLSMVAQGMKFCPSWTTFEATTNFIYNIKISTKLRSPLLGALFYLNSFPLASRMLEPHFYGPWTTFFMTWLVPS